MIDFGANLKRARKEKKLTQRQLADMIGAKHNSISNWENGVNRPDPDTIGLICGALHVSPNVLLGSSMHFSHPEMLPVTVQRVPILGGAACGEPLYAPGDGTEYATVEGDLRCDFALIAQGDSMTGDRIFSGDIVYFVHADDVADGQIAAVAVDDGVSIKRIQRLRAPDGSVLFTQLLSSNPAYAAINIGGPNEVREVHIIGKAVAFKALLNK